MPEIFFLISVLLVLYTYIGYPVLIILLGNLFAKKKLVGNFEPFISIVISAYNEEKYIRNKIKNILSLDYPAGKREILIGSDCSTDSTDAIIREYTAQGVRYFRSDSRSGKPHMLNILTAQAQGEIIIFSDARQIFDDNALRALARNFCDESIGCVSGELILTCHSDGSETEEIGMYWSYEKYLRSMESSFGSMLGATGAIYAIRKKLFQPVPDDILLDDMYIPFNVIAQGYRAIFDDTAKAYDALSSNMAQETIRKIRTLTGNWQLFFRMPGMFNPFKSPIAFQLFSHKALRVLVPYALLAIFITNIFLITLPLYKITLMTQALWYIFAVIGFLMPKKRNIRLINIPFIFCRLNIAAVQGFYSFLTGQQSVIWKR